MATRSSTETRFPSIRRPSATAQPACSRRYRAQDNLEETRHQPKKRVLSGHRRTPPTSPTSLCLEDEGLTLHHTHEALRQEDLHGDCGSRCANSIMSFLVEKRTAVEMPSMGGQRLASRAAAQRVAQIQAKMVRLSAMQSAAPARCGLSTSPPIPSNTISPRQCSFSTSRPLTIRSTEIAAGS